jgi:hypothetical protein
VNHPYPDRVHRSCIADTVVHHSLSLRVAVVVVVRDRVRRRQHRVRVSSGRASRSRRRNSGATPRRGSDARASNTGTGTRGRLPVSGGQVNAIHLAHSLLDRCEALGRGRRGLRDEAGLLGRRGLAVDGLAERVEPRLGLARAQACEWGAVGPGFPSRDDVVLHMAEAPGSCPVDGL